MTTTELPDEALTAGELTEVERFLLALGRALVGSGEAVNEIQEHLQRVAAAYGAPEAQILALPTYVQIAVEPGRAASIERAPQSDGVMRLDQTAALFALLKAAERGSVPPREGVLRIAVIRAMRPRFGRVVTLFGHVVLTVGICLLLRPTAGDLVLAAFFGALVGVFKLVGARFRSVQTITPVFAALAVSWITFVLADQGWANADLRALIPPLATFLPGATLTMSVVELSAGELITGASRFVAGTLQLLLLAFGIIAGAQVAGLPNQLVDSSQNVLGGWAPWLGVLVFGIGNQIYQSAPRRSFGWLLLVLGSAWVGQFAGSQAFGGYFGGFVGALVMTIVAYTIERLPSGPPALVAFLPAFWVLVPGALGLIGVTEYIGNHATVGARDFLAAIAAIVAIALGVLCGYPLFRSLAVTWTRLRPRFVS